MVTFWVGVVTLWVGVVPAQVGGVSSEMVGFGVGVIKGCVGRGMLLRGGISCASAIEAWVIITLY